MVTIVSDSMILHVDFHFMFVLIPFSRALRVRKKMTGDEQIIHMIGDVLCEKVSTSTKGHLYYPYLVVHPDLFALCISFYCVCVCSIR